jgi:hypothetical protein
MQKKKKKKKTSKKTTKKKMGEEKSRLETECAVSVDDKNEDK